MDSLRTYLKQMFDDEYLSRERTIFVCYRFFRQLRNIDMAENPYSQMVLDGTMMRVNGLD